MRRRPDAEVSPLSMLGQLMRVIQPSKLELARDRERQKERERKSKPESLAKQRARMREQRKS